MAKATIVTDTGAEVVTGSTRLKAGTAHKMVLNMLLTVAMVPTGKVIENLMVNVAPTNIKLFDRAARICDTLRLPLPAKDNTPFNLIIKARDLYGGAWGDIFNAKLYKKRVTKRDELIYCAVEFEEDGMEYHYMTEDDTIEEGDFVVVPVGANNRETLATVVEKIYCTEETAPYPISKVKKIIRKVEEKENID